MELRASLLRNTKECRQVPEARRETWNKFALIVLKGHKLTLISDFWPPEL